MKNNDINLLNLNNLSQEELIKMIAEMQQTINKKDEELQVKEAENKELKASLKSLQEKFLLMRKQRFGKASEQSGQLQFDLFNEVEEVIENHQIEATVEEPQAKERKRKVKSNFNHLPVEEIHYDLENKVCDKCGGKLSELAPIITEEVVYVRAHYKRKKYIHHQYTCKHCNENDDLMHLYEGECPPAKLIKGSIASPSLISSIIVKKFLLHLPLYRQELEMQRKKMPINRKNMSNWLNKAYTMYFRSIYDTMYHDILNQDFLHMDETSVTVLEDRKNGTNSKSYMWIMASNRWEENQIRYFSSFSNREYQNAQILLGDSYKGGIHCDGYDAYHKLVNVIIYGCWVHTRRYFIQAFDLLKETSKWNNKSAQEKETFAKTSLPYQHLNYIIQKIDELFHYEKKYKLDSLSIENIYKLRQKEQKPIIDDLFTYISKISGKYTSQSKMGSAINYIINQKEYLINYLNNGKADISNNLAENAIRPFAVGRKNWPFSKTRRGSECSAAYFSIIETCKANSIDPELYLTHVMERCRGKEPNKVDYKTLLPYSKELPEYIRTKNTDKK